MEFSPNNNVVKLCLQGMNMEEKGNLVEAIRLFLQAWHEATNDFEKFISGYYIARHQTNASDKLQWLDTTMQLALKLNDETVKAALPDLYSDISKCYEALGDVANAKEHYHLSIKPTEHPCDSGPFYHGTKAALQTGHLLTAGFSSNYQPEVTMNHIYFTALVNGAGLAAALAAGDGPERVYIVKPTGNFENDPNVTNKKFPGNPTRSYRTLSPLTIIGEVKDWLKQTPEEIQQWRKKLANMKGDIIN